MTIDLDKLGETLQAAAASIMANRDFIEVPTLLEIEGAVKQRVHNNGTDSGGSRIGLKNSRAGKYSPGYEKRKEKIFGNDVYPINLYLTGDLQRGYTTGKEGGKNVIKFQDELSRKKAGWAEDNFKVEIFRPSEGELKDAESVLKAGVSAVLRSTFPG